MDSRTNWLLLRGLTRDQRHWGEFPELATTRLGDTIATIDPPGFGTQNATPSPRTISAITDDIRARFDRGTGNWSVLGISLGGMIAMDWCSRYPGDFHRCVLINTGAKDVASFRNFKPGTLPVFAGRAFRSDYAHESSVLRLSSNQPRATLDRVAREWALYQRDARPTMTSVLSQALAGATFTLPQRLSTPLLILASKRDRLASYRMSERIAERYGAPIRLHPTAGHDLPLDDGPWILDQISQWHAEP